MAKLGPPATLAPPAHDGHVAAALLTGVAICALLVGGFVVAGWVSEPSPEPLGATRAVLMSSTTAVVSRPGWLGVAAVDGVDGVEVVGSDPATPAEATLRTGDLILAVDGVATPRVVDVQSQVARQRPGTMVAIAIRRNHVVMVIQLQVAAHR